MTMNAIFVAWRPSQPDNYGWRPVGRLIHDGGLYRFCYTHGARKPGFQPFPGMKSLDQVYESETLFPVFQNRLLPSSRPEYEAYLRWSGFDISSPPEPVVVLGITEGRRETDALEVFPCPVPDAEHCLLNRFFLHGVRWMHQTTIARIDQLTSDEPLKLMLDHQNSVDRYAVAVRTETDRQMIGYVPRYLAHDVYRLFESCDVDFIKLKVLRLNLDAPLQNRVLCEMKACWPDGFEPCSTEDFRPIPANVPARC